MNSKTILAGILLVTLAVSCASTQFIPQSLEGTPDWELAKISGGFGYYDYVIREVDGIPIEWSLWAGSSHIFIKPGKHIVKYIIPGYDRKYLYCRNMVKLGVEPGMDQCYPNFEESSKTCTLTFGSGKKYSRADVIFLLEDARCL